MNIDKNLINEVKRLMLAKYPRFGSEIAVANIEYRTDLKYHTAATDGKNIYVDPNYLASLSESDRLFLIAHEIMHIKFMHAYRLADKNGNRRNPEIWNTATDAIINANLERDGFRIKDGYVNRPEALKYSAEEFYELLLKEKEENQNSQNGQSSQDGQGQQSEQDSQGEQGEQKNQDGQSEQSGQNKQSGQQGDGEQENNSNEDANFGDDHSLWEEAFENRQNRDKKRQSSSKQSESTDSKDKSQSTDSKDEAQSSDKSSEIEFGFDEKGEFENNRKEKIENFKRKREQTRKRNTRRGTN